MGDRWSSPLDQWPDPEVYVHYPSRQELAYVDVRNLNRAWPGRPGGTLTEKTCYALTQLIDEEKIDIVIDLHEAELQYPVISAIVAHQKGQDLAAMASMMISASEGFEIGVEYSPQALRGLSHREIGDHTGAISLLLEAPEPFLDATRGRTDRELSPHRQGRFHRPGGKTRPALRKDRGRTAGRSTSGSGAIPRHPPDPGGLVRGENRSGPLS